MKPNIFMSYSRRETGFVDDLTDRLEKAGFNIWLDYRRLIPGTPWAGQIDKGLKEADVVLLVVSKDSIASQFVELEWRHVLHETHKRIILAIFEAVDLPPELEQFEWVDFRGSYEAGLKELIEQLNSPVQESHPAPETGFKMPPVVWVTAALAAVAGYLSLFTAYTVLLPWILIPFSWRVLKRNFNYSQTQTALWLLPVAYYYSALLLYEVGLIDITFDASVMTFQVAAWYFMAIQFVVVLLVCAALLLLLRSPAMQRWGKPEATMPKFANLYKPNEPRPRSVRFWIDYAPQDAHVAKEFSKGLFKYGHSLEADIKSAEVVFVLISRFKTDTEADPQHQAVFPVLVQTAELSEKLSHVQWIDFRKGVRNVDAIAQLLPQPEKMLTALGVRPASGVQIVLPGIISALVLFFTIFIVLDAGMFFVYILQLWYMDGGIILTKAPQPFLVYAVLMIPANGIAYFAIKALTERRGWLASIGMMFLAQMVLSGLVLWQTFQSQYIDFAYAELGITNPVFGIMALLLAYTWFGIFFLDVAAIFRFGDLRRWFPSAGRIKKGL